MKYLSKSDVAVVDVLVVCPQGTRCSVVGAEALRAILELCVAPKIAWRRPTVHVGMHL